MHHLIYNYFCNIYIPFLLYLTITESVLTVANYVSISPISINNNTDYVSASLIANNPMDYALTRLQQFYYQRHEQCLVSVVVSLGTGIYVHSKMGSFPRISSLKFRSRRAYHRLQNFVLLLRNSVSWCKCACTCTVHVCKFVYCTCACFLISMMCRVTSVRGFWSKF